MTRAPSQLWWTAAELAEARLPDMPTSKRRINDLAARSGWQVAPGFARRRQGRGGGWEYHWTALPHRAQAKILAMAKAPKADARPDRGEAWANYEALTAAAKEKAAERLAHLHSFNALVSAGLSRDAAACDVARVAACAPRTVWNWIKAVDGVEPSDWLAYLAPRHKAAPRTVHKVVCDREFMDLLKADFLRPEQPSFSSCFERVAEICAAKGIAIPVERMARRRMSEEVPRVSQVFAREGEAGLLKCFPPQIRDKTQLGAMEVVNADCHKFDVFVRWLALLHNSAEGRASPLPGRTYPMGSVTGMPRAV